MRLLSWALTALTYDAFMGSLRGDSIGSHVVLSSAHEVYRDFVAGAFFVVLSRDPMALSWWCMCFHRGVYAFVVCFDAPPWALGASFRYALVVFS